MMISSTRHTHPLTYQSVNESPSTLGPILRISTGIIPGRLDTSWKCFFLFSSCITLTHLSILTHVVLAYL